MNSVASSGLDSTLRIMWANTGYNGRPLARYARAVAAITVEVAARTSPHSFQVLRRRWVIKRTFGWLMRYRRLARDCERTTANSEAVIYRAAAIIMTRCPACCDNGQLPIWRRGGERPRPAGQAALPAGPRVVTFTVTDIPPLADEEDPVAVAGERETLEGFLEYHRRVLSGKLRGLSEEDARRRPVPSATTMLGLVSHAAVERNWFQH